MMKVLLRYSVECTLVVEAENVEAAVKIGENTDFCDWGHDRGPVGGENITHADPPAVT